MITPTPIIQLAGQSYPLAWGNLALARFRSIPFAQRGVEGPGQLAQLVWAAFRGVQNPFPSWEHVLAAIAEESASNYEAIDAAMASALPPLPEKKGDTTPNSAPEPSDVEKKSGSHVTTHSPAAASG